MAKPKKSAPTQPPKDDKLTETPPAGGAPATDQATDQPGDGGAREAEVAGAMERFEGLASELQLGDTQSRIIANATEWGIELIKRRPKAWDQLSRDEQRDLQAAIEHNMTELVRQIVEAVAADGRQAIRCLLVGFTDKGEEIKAELKVKSLSREETEQAVIGLHRARGKHVLLTVASASDYAEEPAPDMSEPEQRALGFEAGSDQHESDDSDLVEAAEAVAGGGAEPPVELAQTGMQMLVPQYGLCEIRVNLKTGMIEAKHPNRDGFDIDVREATGVELAAERDRQQADFDQTDDASANQAESEPA